MCSGPFIPLEGRGLSSVQWAHHLYLALQDEVYPVCSEPLIHPSCERRITQCAVGPSSLLREEVYPVCSGPLIPPERGGLPSVQWALHPS